MGKGRGYGYTMPTNEMSAQGKGEGQVGVASLRQPMKMSAPKGKG